MLLPPIHIPLVPLPLCSHLYSDPTRLLSHGEARPLAGQPAPQGSAPVSREESYSSQKIEIQSQQQISTNQLIAMDFDTNSAMTIIWRDSIVHGQNPLLHESSCLQPTCFMASWTAVLCSCWMPASTKYAHTTKMLNIPHNMLSWIQMEILVYPLNNSAS